MPSRRKDVVVEETKGVYHCISQCVRRAYLCGIDPYSGKSLEHRPEWIRSRLKKQAAYYAVEVCAYAVMPNHLHVVMRTRPDWVAEWTEQETARRWLMLFPKRKDKSGKPLPPLKREILNLTRFKDVLTQLNRRLGSVSWFMRSLNEYVARQSNKEDGTKGRFWEGRFRAQILLDEPAWLACLAFVDLNPIRTKIAATLEDNEYTSAFERLKARSASKSEPLESKETESDRSGAQTWLCPIGNEAGDDRRSLLSISLDEYLDLLDWTGRQISSGSRDAVPASLMPIMERLRINEDLWVNTVVDFGHLFHKAAGTAEAMTAMARESGLSWLRGIKAGQASFSRP